MCLAANLAEADTVFAASRVAQAPLTLTTSAAAETVLAGGGGLTFSDASSTLSLAPPAAPTR